MLGRPPGISVCAVAFAALVLPTWAGQRNASGPQGDTYQSIAQLPDWSGAWVIPFAEFRLETGRQRDPTDLNAPRLTPRFAEMAAAYPARRHSNAEACLPTGMPNAMRYAFAIEFLFTPGRVTLLLEQDSMIRRIYTDGRAHVNDPDSTFAGESIGHWEGQTLIVDTTGIDARAELRAGVPTSGKAHVIERIRRIDARHLQIDTVIEDPDALKSPWRHTRIYERSDSRFFEQICQDNNRDVNGGEPNLVAPE